MGEKKIRQLYTCVDIQIIHKNETIQDNSRRNQPINMQIN